jgi:hypothetical protein
MNARQRDIIADTYRHYIECCMHSDIAGFTSDMSYFFENIRATDSRLDSLLNEVYDKIPDII